jgi:carboxymethylenebutenolidase
MRILLPVLAAVIAFGGAQNGPDQAPTKIKIGSDRSAVNALEFHPKGPGPFPAVIVLHGDFGANAWFNAQAQRLASKGYLVLALDLYGGELPKTVEEAHILERGLEEGKVHDQITAAVDYLAKNQAVRAGSIGIVGWDMGGGYALDLAIREPRIKAAVNCYGRLTTDPAQLAKIKGSLLCLFAGKDEGMPKETIDQFQSAFKKAGKSATLHTYPDCPTCFMEPGSPYHNGRIDQVVIADAWSRIEKHLADALRP